MNSCFDSFSTIGAKAKKARALVLNIGSQNTVVISSSYFITLFRHTILHTMHQCLRTCRFECRLWSSFQHDNESGVE
jgi:hypothetical protein